MRRREGEILKRLAGVEHELQALREEIENRSFRVEVVDPNYPPPQCQPYYWPAQYDPQYELSFWTSSDLRWPLLD